MKIIILLTLIFSSVAFAEKAPDRGQSKTRIMEACMKLAKQTASAKKSICECVVRNLAVKLSDTDLALIADEYEGKGGKDETVASAVITYDMDVAEACVADAKYNVNATETVKKKK